MRGRDTLLEPRVSPPAGLSAEEARRRWPEAIEMLGRMYELFGSTGSLSVDPDGTLAFSSDVPSSDITWCDGMWCDDDGMYFNGETWWVR